MGGVQVSDRSPTTRLSQVKLSEVGCAEFSLRLIGLGWVGLSLEFVGLGCLLSL